MYGTYHTEKRKAKSQVMPLTIIVEFAKGGEGTIPTVVKKPMLRIRIHRNHMFLGLPYPDPDPLVRGMYPDPDPDPSIIMQK
jgi:hypothetical protein